MTKKYNFGEKDYEKDVKTGERLEVWQSPKYKTSKDKAIEMIESKKYDLSEADFWILKNKAGEQIAYSGLIISHNGCLKINDAMENKVNPKCFSIDKDGYNNSLVYIYADDDTYEVGEFSPANGKNAYPYAMAFKRCFDRVVLKKSKLAFSGIYSEVEADEFKKQENNYEALPSLEELIIKYEIDRETIYKEYGVNDLIDLTSEQTASAIKKIQDWAVRQEKKKGNKNE